MSGAQSDASSAKMEAQAAHDLALLAKNQSESTKADLLALLERITTFLTADGADPNEIRQVFDVTNKLLARAITSITLQHNEHF